MRKNTLSYRGALCCALLDYDDTLAPTEVLAMEAAASLANEILEALGDPQRFTPEEFVLAFTGMPFLSILRKLREDHGLEISDAKIADYVAIERDRVISALERGLQGTAGAVEMLECLMGMGVSAAIVSSSAKERLEVCLRATGQHSCIRGEWVFSAQTSLPTPLPKPHPAIYLHAIHTCQKTVEECFCVEDSVSGVRAAAAAELPLIIGFVGFAEDKSARAKQLLENGAHVIIDDLRAVPEIVIAYNRQQVEQLEKLYALPWAA